MTTVIDSLVVKLGLDNKEFKAGMKDTDATAKAAVSSLSKLLAVVGGMAAFKHFTTELTEANANLARLSQNLGISATTLSAWGNAAELAGGSAEGLYSTFDMLSRSQTELELTGSTGMIPYLSMLGVSFNQAGDQAELLLQISDKLAHVDRTKANNILRGMGIDQGTANLLLKTRPEVEKMLALQKSQRDSADRQAAASLKLSEATTKLKQSITNLGYDALEKITPFLEAFIGGLASFSQWIRDHGEFTTAFVGTLAVALGVAQRAAIAAAASMALAVAPILLFAGALALAWDDYRKWKEGGDSLLGDNWGKGLAVLRWVSDLLGDIIYRAIAASDAIGGMFSGDFGRVKFALGELISGSPEESAGAPAAKMGDRESFIKAAAKSLGVPESAIDAQLRLETGASGKSTIGNFNYGNIKAGSAWRGDVKSRNVTEYGANGAYTTSSAFRSYASPEDAARDYATMIMTRFPGAVGAKDAAGFAQGLKSGGYATDPNYVSKIASIARGIPGASAMASVGTAPQLAGGNNINNTIGEVKIYTAANDAAGIARDMGRAMDYTLTSQANYGLN